jgi:BirA family transcriptional regulator, biotin operon repressor / biotin---[acetyl-CoA-carboxylase] ligase
VNIALLHRLRDARGAFLALDTLGPDVNAVRGELAELEAFGFGLEHHPYHGIAYRGPAERLCPDLIEWGLNPRWVGRRVAVWNRVSSTNDVASRAARSRTNDGLVVLAEDQTSGRGRRGRSWVAPARTSVLMSVLLFPPEPLASPAWLTALGAVAAAEVVEAWTGRCATIKWPNDVRVAGCKIAGVLVERGLGAVIGIGLNVNNNADDFPPALRGQCTSLRLLTGEPADRSEVARALVARLDDLYDRGRTLGPGALGTLWRTRFEPLGRLVRVQTASETLTGHLLDADLLDGLTLASTDGPPGRIPALDVVALTYDDDAHSPV